MRQKKYFIIAGIEILLIILTVIVAGKIIGLKKTDNTDVYLNLNSDNGNITISAPINSFAYDQNPSFTLVKADKSTNTAVPSTLKIVSAANKIVYEQTVGPTESFEVIVDKAKLTPGRYKIIVTSGNKTVTQDFTWGVLAINTNKSIYTTGETANLALAVLDENGNMVCDADVVLTITDPKGNKTILKTSDKSITVSNSCAKKIFTLTPDFAASYKILNPGMYTMDLISTTKNGVFHIRDNFTAENTPTFSVERVTATRIFPPKSYPMTFHLGFNRPFTGTVTEKVPAGFQVTNIAQNGQLIQNSDKTQEIHWPISVLSGNTINLTYTYKTPEKSPDWYALGPLTMIENGTEVFQESRVWQLAIDTATSNSFQRKTWWDGTYYWRGYNDTANSRIRFDYSSDGSSWTENTSAQITVNTNDFSIEADSTNLFIVYTSSNDIRGAKATSYPTTTFSWTGDQVVFNGTGATDDYSYPVISRDSSSYVWVGARYTGSSVYYFKTMKETSAINDLPEDSGDTTYLLANPSNSNSNVYGTMVSIGSQNMYTAFVATTTLEGCTWVNASTTWQDSIGATCSWYNGSWPYRVKLTIDHTKVAADQTDFPVYVDLSNMPAGFHSHVNQTDGRDIRVTTSNGVTELPREVVFYNSTSDTGELYFKYSGTLSSSTDTNVYIYYGNSGASDYAVTNTYGRNNVWNSNYMTVQHLKDTTTSSTTDSTSNNNNMTKKAAARPPETSSGKIAQAQDLDGSYDLLYHSDSTSLDVGGSALTISAWIKAGTLPSAGNQAYLIHKEDSVTAGYGLKLGNFDSAGNQLYLEVNNTSDTTFTRESLTSETFSTGTWYYVTGVLPGAGSLPLVYINAVNKDGWTDGGNFSGTIKNGDWNFDIGTSTDGGGDYFDGIMDEVRISNVARSATWITTDYNNQLTPSTFFNSWGAEQSSGSYDLIATVTSGLSANIAAVSDSSGNIHLTYINASGNTMYQKYTLPSRGFGPPLFANSFEGADTNLCDGGDGWSSGVCDSGNTAVGNDTSTVYSPVYAGKFTSNGTNDSAYTEGTFSTANPLYVRAYFRINSNDLGTGQQLSLLYIQDSTNWESSELNIQKQAGGDFKIGAGFMGGYSSWVSSISQGVWYDIEYKVTRSTTIGTIDVWLNGSNIISLTNQNTGAVSADWILIGLTNAVTNSNQISVDNVVVDNAAIGAYPWGAAVTLDSNAGNAYSTISLNSTTSDLYAMWIRSNHVYYKKATYSAGAWTWDVSATDWKTTGTNTDVTSNYSEAGKIFAEWYDGSAVQWDKIIPTGATPTPTVTPTGTPTPTPTPIPGHMNIEGVKMEGIKIN
jgi:hypothetical protein